MGLLAEIPHLIVQVESKWLCTALFNARRCAWQVKGFAGEAASVLGADIAVEELVAAIQHEVFESRTPFAHGVVHIHLK